MKLLFDTTVIVDFQRKREGIVDYLNKQNEVVVSTVTAGETIQGARSKKELRDIQEMIGHFKILPITAEVSALALEYLENYSLAYGLLILDALVAATATKNRFTLITSDTKHFKMIGELKLQDWNKLEL
ncbi:hypothetical protein A2630_02995 [Candidatus Woesebacteria bacterium RIFCSPHIGHO2_01_FULL_44_10]|uniref:Ribonuclease VapC n=1 Tax=Candidatus Woesebacteria bacterium RIFCSPLOWO2_01_FULL_44_14 TaxID=1802525 RepID=A0A1F8C2F9_9BACT|nr:MAG: hypothetical protein A2630_02995 [Candidatus Woesebacteria bacterium RIFCSPHIGHO2_01_FULL_44_10]OGM55749.1 MAG: hypothetical protein A3F62_04685 [Candidatus Woesebacteria bacterium RIFCSPHIGHO2_12_FULL_44_11]OGM70536.1 MAG: hypothetical protein A2975_02025 [Candidatus Woesebacteria bacterium RIFCSPLOWO2_01_FULL_44_14]